MHIKKNNLSNFGYIKLYIYIEKPCTNILNCIKMYALQVNIIMRVNC